MIATRTPTSLAAALLALGLVLCAPGAAVAGPALVDDLPAESDADDPVFEAVESDAVAGPRARLRRVGRHRVGLRHRHHLHRRAVHLHPHGHVAVIAARRDPDARPVFSMGVGAAIALAFDDWIDSDEIGESVGFIMPFRWRPLRWLGLTYDFGIVWRVDDAEHDHDTELRVQHGLGVTWYPFGGEWLDAFVSAGATLATVHLDHSLSETEYFEYGGFAGVGVEMYFGYWRGVVLEARVMQLHRADEDEVNEDRPGYTRRAPAERLAAMFHATYQFNLY